MSKSGLFSQLGIKVTTVTLAAFAVAIGIFLLIYEVAVPEFLYGQRFAEYWAKKEVAAQEDFQKYVADNEMTMWAAVQDVNWEKTYHTMYPYVEKYDPDNEAWNGVEEYAKHKIQCSDGVVYAFFYSSTGYYNNVGRIIGLMMATACFVLIFLPYIYHIVHRITRLSKDMEILAGGDLSYKIVSTGRDELAELSRDIEGMRCSVLEQIAHENDAILANSRLITSLSHDLRTPLTKLTGYLELLQYEKFKDDKERKQYLQKALEKARQMRSLSDEMFRHFQVQKEPEKESIEIAFNSNRLSQIISEQCFDLQVFGFEITSPTIDGSYTFHIQDEDMQRVFDNLFSNLKKYADPQWPVRVSIDEFPCEVKITLENRIKCSVIADSRGIGLPTVRSLLADNHGRIEIEQKENIYKTFIFLPKFL